MKLKQIEFLPENIAEELTPRDNWALISIACPGEYLAIRMIWPALLSLRFHDIGPIKKTRLSPRQIKKLKGKELVSFSPSQAEKIINFLDEIEDSESIDTLIIHCKWGVSRSAAVALFAYENYSDMQYGLMGTERYNRHVFSVLNSTFEERKP